MKINSTLVAAALGLASVSLANATQYIYLTGSTAARGAVFNTLTNGTAGGFDAAPVWSSYGNALAANGTYMEFSNTISGTPTIIKCDWSGSEAGIADVSGTATEPFPADFGVGGIAAGVTSATKPSGTGLVTNTVDLAMADNGIAYSKNPSSTAIQSAHPVVVVPFVFVKTTTTIPDQDAFTNVTDNAFKVLAAGGDALTLFTGNPADINNNVYLAGRDNNSGTRVNTFDETGYGSGKATVQIELDGSGQLVKFGSIYTTPSGQSSGGTLAGTLTNTTGTVDFIADSSGATKGIVAVAYLGLADDATAEGSPNFATRLNYNGVAYSAANVENGTYTLWGNEYILQKNGDTTSDINTVFSAIQANASANTDQYEIPLSSMNVSRTGPNSPVSY
jgi:hypothetical protein